MPRLPLSARGVLLEQAGPSSPLAAEVIPALFEAIRAVSRTSTSTSTSTSTRDASPALRASYQAWRTRFGQVVGVSSHRLDRVVGDWSGRHGRAYHDDVPAWLFALHTWLGLALRLPAAFALPGAAELLADRRTPLASRMESFESGALFSSAGVANLRSGTLGWYVHDPVFPAIVPQLEEAIRSMGRAGSGLDTDAWSGDDFRNLYEALVPQDLRHALGEIYTPDAYIAHALDVLDWRIDESLLDPTCGMGGFLLEAVRRRLAGREESDVPGSAPELLEGLAGFDINPLAVLAARAALTLRLARCFAPGRAAVLPVYVADAVLLASTEQELDVGQSAPEREDLARARKIPRVRCIAGNPPWVRWSQLPPDYAAAIRPYCAAANVFSRDRYVGGIEADMSAVITHLAARRWLEPGGRMAFYLPSALFSTESGEGFRRLDDHDGSPVAAFECVEDLRSEHPFDGVNAPSALVLLRGGARTIYPVRWRVVEGQRTEELEARPIPGTEHGPWLRGTAADHLLWRSLFDAARQADYRARKGVTTDCNGVYFVRVLEKKGELVLIENDPELGRKEGIERVQAWVEDTHLFPLMRGRGLWAFRAVVDPGRYVIVPQRTMHGDPELETSAPRTWEFFRRFEDTLRARGSYRRYQKGKPFWSTWSTGAYTFSPWKVLWKEMSGARFCAAAAGPIATAHLQERPIVPDHKLYFVPVDGEDEARFLCGILNAPTLARAVSAYAAQLSLGVSVVESLRIPRYQPDDPGHARVAELSRRAAADPASFGTIASALDDVAVAIVQGAPWQHGATVL